MSAPTQNRPSNPPRVEHASVYVSRGRFSLGRLTRLDRLTSRLSLDKLPHPSLPADAKAGLARRARPFGVASAVAAGWAAGMGLLLVVVPVLLTWALAAHADSSARAALVMAANIWLAANHVSFSVGAGTFGLLPLGLLVLPFLLLRASVGWAARILRPATLPDAALLVSATAVLYGLLGGLVAVLASTDDVHAAAWEAFAWCAAIAVGCAGATVLRTRDLGGEIAVRLPGTLLAVVRPAIVGLVTVLAGSAVLVVLSLVVHGGDALALSRALGGGVVGTIVLVVMSVVYLPNLVVWGAAFCIGPGFAVGAGTSVTLAGVSSGPLPAFPLLAAVPSSGVPPWWAWSCVLIPLAAGVVTARSLLAAGSRSQPGSQPRSEPGSQPEEAALLAGLAGVVAGLGLGGLAWLSGGPLGAERLSVLGPSAWQVGALAAIELGLVAAVAAWTTAWWRTRG